MVDTITVYTFYRYDAAKNMRMAKITERLPYRYCMMCNFCWISNNRSGVASISTDIFFEQYWCGSLAKITTPLNENARSFVDDIFLWCLRYCQYTVIQLLLRLLQWHSWTNGFYMVSLNHANPVQLFFLHCYEVDANVFSIWYFCRHLTHFSLSLCDSANSVKK